MNELKLLQEFRAAVAAPDDAVLARARARMLGSRTAGPGRPARWPRLPGTWPRLALTGLAATATAAAVTMALLVPGGGPARPATLTVKELAYRAAAAAAAQPPVAPGQWVYWRETSINLPGVVSPQHSRPDSVRSTYRVWTTADGIKAAFIVDGKMRVICPGQTIRRSCNRGELLPQPPMVGQPTVQPRHGKYQIIGFSLATFPVSYADLNSLPRDPVALDRYLASFRQPGQSAADCEFETIAELLVSYVMPPALTAELYRALGDVPDVMVNDHAVDAVGRTGIGFQIRSPAYHPVDLYPIEELVLDPRTYEWMGYQSSFVDGLRPATAVLQSALVSGPGVMP